jgi:transposase
MRVGASVFRDVRAKAIATRVRLWWLTLKNRCLICGNRYARAALVQVAQVVCRMPQTQYAALYRRIAARRGKKRALIAVAHALVRTIYHLLKNDVEYQEPGPDYLLKRNPERELNDLKRRAARLGLDLVPQAA